MRRASGPTKRLQKEVTQLEQSPDLGIEGSRLKYFELQSESEQLLVEVSNPSATLLRFLLDVTDYPFACPSVSLTSFSGQLDVDTFVISLDEALRDLQEGWSPMTKDNIRQTIQKVVSAVVLSADKQRQDQTLEQQANKVTVHPCPPPAPERKLAGVADKNFTFWDQYEHPNGFLLDAVSESGSGSSKSDGDGMKIVILGTDTKNSACAFEVQGVLTRAEAVQYIRCFDRLGFDRTHHPLYQSQDIDAKEFAYMRNERSVYQASAEETERLFARLVPHLPPQFDASGTAWRVWGLNDMWRCYRYDRPGQEFPPHYDNNTVGR